MTHNRRDGPAGGPSTMLARVVLGVAAIVLAGLVVAVTRSVDGLVAVSAFLAATATVVCRIVRR